MVERKSILTNASYLFSSEVLIRAGSFFLIIILARFLGDANLGIYTYAFGLGSLIIYLLDFGILTFLIKEIAKEKEKTQEYFNNIATMKIFLNLLSLIIIVILAFTVDKARSAADIVIIAGISLFFNYVGYAFNALFRAYEDMKHLAIANFIERFFAIAFGTYLIIKGYPLIYFVTLLAFTYFLYFLYLYIKSRKIIIYKPTINPKFWKKAIITSLPFWFTEFFFIIYFRIDAIMLPLFTSFEITGWYSAAYKIIDGLSFIPVIAIYATFPAMSRMYKENKDELKRIFRKTFYYLMVLSIPTSVGIFVIADRLIPLVYGPQFTHSIIALKILIAAHILISLNYITGFLLNAIDKQKTFTYITGFGALLNIVLNAILIPMFQYGYPGAGIATVITQTFNVILLLYFASKAGFNIKYFQTLFKPIIAALIMVITILLLKQYHLILVITSAVASYFLILLIIKGIQKEELDLIKEKLKLT